MRDDEWPSGALRDLDHHRASVNRCSSARVSVWRARSRTFSRTSPSWRGFLPLAPRLEHRARSLSVDRSVVNYVVKPHVHACFGSSERGVARQLLEELPPTIVKEQNTFAEMRLELILEDIEGSWVWLWPGDKPIANFPAVGN